MKHLTSPEFWERFNELPRNIQDLAKKSFTLLKENPEHPSLHLKRVAKYWSVRVGKRYRALGVETKGGILWFWIGTHAEYDKLV